MNYEKAKQQAIEQLRKDIRAAVDRFARAPNFEEAEYCEIVGSELEDLASGVKMRLEELAE